MELEWLALVDTAADGTRCYHRNTAYVNDVLSFDSIVRFRHQDFDQGHFQLKFKAHEQVLDCMID